MLQKTLQMERFFTADIKGNPLDHVNYIKKDMVIKDHQGREIFHLKDGEFPEFWSENACRIVSSKYFCRRKDRTETSVRQIIERVTHRFCEFAIRDGYLDQESAEVFRDELRYLLVHQIGCFNSPVWFNLGLYEAGTEQTSACFILNLEDNMESLLKCQRDEVMIAKNGSGSGVVNSKIRSVRDMMSRGGRPSGPLSFMKARDSWANIILSGGVLRRFAKMEILHYWHPDIDDFVDVKGLEEEKARRLGPEYHPWFQNSNFSVRLDGKFWEKYKKDEDILCYDRRGDKVLHQYKARALMRKIAEGTHRCGDPGVQYEDTMYKWITTRGDSTDIITNPCSEYIWYPNTSCNLASLNVVKFMDAQGNINYTALEKAVNTFIIAQDLLVHTSGYPTEEIFENTKKYRNLGLGFSNLGAALMRKALSYNSDEGREFARDFQSHLQYYSLKQSVRLAREIGPAEGYDEEKTLESLSLSAEYLKGPLHRSWMALLDEVKEVGLRNCQVSVLAPTGTISFMMDCETTGIEPVLYLKQVKNVVDGYRMEITIPSVEDALRKLEYPEETILRIMDHVVQKSTVEWCEDLLEEHLPIFDTSFSAFDGGRSLPPEAHIDMCASVQPFVSGGISKTVNLPHEITVEEIEALYLRAYEKGLKCVAMYRDGSKVHQVLEKPGEKKKKEEGQPKVRGFGERKKLPDTCDARRHKFSVGGHSGFLHYSCYPDTKEIGEIFMTMSREGSTLGGLLDCFAASISIGLQYGVPIDEYIRKFINTRFVPSGYTDNKKVRRASSIVDYVFRYLALEFERKDLLGMPAEDLETNGTSHTPPSESASHNDDGINNGGGTILDGPPCDVCGSMTYVSGACYVCSNCGTTTGCG